VMRRPYRCGPRRLAPQERDGAVGPVVLAAVSKRTAILRDNEERFSLGGAAHETRGVAAGAGSRAGERKTLFIIIREIREEQATRLRNRIACR
jgi:hypothetical protein